GTESARPYDPPDRDTQRAHRESRDGSGSSGLAPRFETRRGAAGPSIDAGPGLGWLQPDLDDVPVVERSADNPRVVRPPRKSAQRLQADLVGKQQIQGQHPGDRYVRVIRQHSDDFALAGPGHLVASEESMQGEGSVGRFYSKVKRVMIGAPLTTAAAAHERLTKLKALAVLSSDALSSVAYATEEILRVLLIAGGVGALSTSLPIGAAIVALLIIVGVSYRQTIKAYPLGGGSYIVAKDNTGEIPALTAGAALMTDYVLTVAVSIAAAVAAMVSAFPGLHTHRIGIGLGFILLVTVLNLRGIRESGSIFSVPTYLFIAGMAAVIVLGFARNAIDGFPVHHPAVEASQIGGSGAITLFIILRAFSAGCSAMTGVEAISDGVPAFNPPEWRNARTTLTFMIGILAVMFTGVTFLAHQYGAYAMESSNSGYETVVSQIAREVFGGRNLAYYYIQFSTMAILVLAANTAFSDFPRLSYFLARDRYLPRQFTFRGDRLAFTTGIVTLGIFAGLVLVIAGGEVERLIPLYALGVFTSFTISQFSMFIRWQRRREPGWRSGRIINLAGAAATAIVALVVGITKIPEGAWTIVLIIVGLIFMMRGIHRHYTRAAVELASDTPLESSEIHHTVIVPVSDVNRVARQTLAYAHSISDNVTAVHITDDEEAIDKMREAWSRLGLDIPLVIIESPYRALVNPLLRYVDEISRQRPGDTVTVVLPEFIARHWWEQLLHNQTALRIKAALLFRPGTVVTSVPYHLERSRPDRTG
ncbi:MAG: APC family permease, partial [Thermomicrobiales bacterium]